MVPFERVVVMAPRVNGDIAVETCYFISVPIAVIKACIVLSALIAYPRLDNAPMIDSRTYQRQP